jgi:acyl-CoA hydrolase
MDGKYVRESYSEYSELALPNDANGLGNLLGGKVMHLVDLAGAMAAMRHSRTPVVTASVDHMNFLRPVRIGQWVRLSSAVNRAFRTSMEVGVKVFVEDLIRGEIWHTCSAYLTFVGVDIHSVPVHVPAIIPETDDEKRRYEQAGERREYRLALRKRQHASPPRPYTCT